MLKECLKMTTGNCTRCPAFEQALRYIEAGAKYQSVIDITKETACPPNHEPSVEMTIDKNGAVTQIVLEGEKL